MAGRFAAFVLGLAVSLSLFTMGYSKHDARADAAAGAVETSCTAPGDVLSNPPGIVINVKMNASPHILFWRTVSADGLATVHTDVPYSLVSADSLALNGVPACGSRADDRGELVVVFPLPAVRDTVTPTRNALVLTCETREGIAVRGTDVIEVR